MLPLHKFGPISGGNPCHLCWHSCFIGWDQRLCMFQVTDNETGAACTPIVAMWNMNNSFISLLRRSFRSSTMQIMMDINASLFNPFMVPGFLTLARIWFVNFLHCFLLDLYNSWSPHLLKGSAFCFPKHWPNACFFAINDMQRDGPMRQGEFWHPR